MKEYRSEGVKTNVMTDANGNTLRGDVILSETKDLAKSHVFYQRKYFVFFVYFV